MSREVADGGVLDLEGYLGRIGYSGGLDPCLETLEQLHLAHVGHIPFENLDILLGKPIRLDLESLQTKLVRGGRGGYCFEQNLLFSAVLSHLGFTVLQLAARVRSQPGRVLPRTHMLLLVQAAGGQWLADVGFGADSPLLPVPFEPRRKSKQFNWSYRIIDETGQWVLQMLRCGAWRDLYSFTLEPQLQVDYEVANHFTSTWEHSRFVLTLTAQLPGPEKRIALRNREIVIDDGKTIQKQELEEGRLLAYLRQVFNLHFAPGTEFKIREC